MTEIKKRLMAYIAHKGISVRSFEQAAGLSTSYVKNLTDPTASRLMRMRDAFPDLNIWWLMTGEGNMLLERKGSGYGGISFAAGKGVSIQQNNIGDNGLALAVGGDLRHPEEERELREENKRLKESNAQFKNEVAYLRKLLLTTIEKVGGTHP